MFWNFYSKKLDVRCYTFKNKLDCCGISESKLKILDFVDFNVTVDKSKRELKLFVVHSKTMKSTVILGHD